MKSLTPVVRATIVLTGVVSGYRLPLRTLAFWELLVVSCWRITGTFALTLVGFIYAGLAFSQDAQNGTSGATTQNSDSNHARTIQEGEFIIQYVPGATDKDRDRVSSEVGATIKRRVSKGAGGRPGYDLVSVRFHGRPTRAELAAVVKKIEKDSAVDFAEVNGIYVAQSSSD